MPKAALSPTTPARVFHPPPEALARFEAALADLALSAREQLEFVIQAGVEALDAIDSDADLEPELASPEFHPVPGQYGRAACSQEFWAQGASDEREDTCEDEGAQCEDEGVSGALDPDNEPSLGSQESDRGGTIWFPHRDDHGGGEGEDDGRSVAAIDRARRAYRPPWANVGEFMPVRSL